MPDTFRCSLVTPEQQVLDEEVVYASIPAWDGQIGLMKERAPLLAKLGDGALRLDFAAGGSRWFFVAGGFAQMKDDKLSVLTEEAIAAEEVVHADAQQALADAAAMPSISDADFHKKERATARAKALLGLLAEHGAKGSSS